MPKSIKIDVKKLTLKEKLIINDYSYDTKLQRFNITSDELTKRGINLSKVESDIQSFIKKFNIENVTEYFTRKSYYHDNEDKVQLICNHISFIHNGVEVFFVNGNSGASYEIYIEDFKFEIDKKFDSDLIADIEKKYNDYISRKEEYNRFKTMLTDYVNKNGGSEDDITFDKDNKVFQWFSEPNGETIMLHTSDEEYYFDIFKIKQKSLK